MSRRAAALRIPAIAMAAALFAGGAAAADAPTTVRGVTVTPQASQKVIQRRVATFVRGMTAQSYDQALTVWRAPICPLVAGMAREQAEFILARLSQIATATGAPLAPQTCRANFYVLATTDPDRLVRAWHAHDNGIFGHARPAKVQRFVETPRPVRIWRNADLESPDGRILANDPKTFGGVRTVHFVDDSLLKWNAAENLQSVLVIVDAGRLKGVTYDQLADYIGVAGLSDVDLDANLGDAPTILKLFRTGADRPPGLTDWDRAFLKGLYHTSQTLKMQSSVIASKMVRELAP